MRSNQRFHPTATPLAWLPSLTLGAGEPERWAKLAVAQFLMLAIGASAS